MKQTLQTFRRITLIPGTLAILSAVDFLPSDKILDMGCGYGVVGILAAKLIGQERVTMCDISESAVKQAKLTEDEIKKYLEEHLCKSK
ncbi:MAG: methyltransferase [Oscillospiraceae bacterium]|nr:methyltransferase [Oscillospiraceae bacterium]